MSPLTCVLELKSGTNIYIFSQLSQGESYSIEARSHGKSYRNLGKVSGRVFQKKVSQPWKIGLKCVKIRHFGIYSRFFKYDSMGALSLLIKFMFEGTNKNTTEYISFFNVC